MVVNGGNARLHVFDEDGELDESPRTWSGSRTQIDAEPLSIGVGQGFDMAHHARMDDEVYHQRWMSETGFSLLKEGDGGN